MCTIIIYYHRADNQSGKGLFMEEYAEDVLEKAEVVAREMIANGKSLDEFQFGHSAGSLWIASDRSKVVVDHIMVVEGKEFYLGLFMK